MVLAIVVLLVRGEISVKTNVLENVHRVAVDKQQENVMAASTMPISCTIAMFHAVRNGQIAEHVGPKPVHVHHATLASGARIVLITVVWVASNVINPQASVNYACQAFGVQTVRNLVSMKIVFNAACLTEHAKSVLMDFGDQIVNTNAFWMAVNTLDVRKIVAIAKRVKRITGEPSVTDRVTIQTA